MCDRDPDAGPEGINVSYRGNEDEDDDDDASGSDGEKEAYLAKCALGGFQLGYGGRPDTTPGAGAAVVAVLPLAGVRLGVGGRGNDLAVAGRWMFRGLGGISATTLGTANDCQYMYIRRDE